MNLPSDINPEITKEEILEAIKIHCRNSKKQFEELLKNNSNLKEVFDRIKNKPVSRSDRKPS